MALRALSRVSLSYQLGKSGHRATCLLQGQPTVTLGRSFSVDPDRSFLSSASHRQGVHSSGRCHVLSQTSHVTRQWSAPPTVRLMTGDATAGSDSEKGSLVYVGTLSKMVKIVKGFSVSTSMLGLGVQPFLYKSLSQLPAVLTLVVGGSLSFFIVLSPLLLHLITKRYVTSLYYDRQTRVFTATTLTFFLGTQVHTFKAGDVQVPDLPRPFSTMTVKGQAMFVDPSTFLDRDVYVHLMGYDKPLDWEDLTRHEDDQGRERK